MYCLDYAKRSQSGNLLSFMLHKPVFLGYHSQFALYPSSSLCIHTVVNFTTIRCGYGTDAFPFSIFLYQCFLNANIHQHAVALYKPLSLRIRPPDTCESASTYYKIAKHLKLWLLFAFALSSTPK